MSRSFQTDAIVLRTFRIGDIHKGVSLLSATGGLIDATAYGAYKGSGKLGGSTDPFTLGRFYFYRDPVKERTRINDTETCDLFENIRNDLVRFYIACFWSEIILASFGAGGEDETLFPLLLESLRALDRSAESTGRVFIQFGWRFLELLGVRSEAGECSSCGRVAGEDEFLYLDPLGRGLLCEQCRGGSQFPIGPGALRYLRFTGSMSLEKAVGVRIDGDTENQLKAAVLRMIGTAVDQPLKTVELL